MIKLTKTPANPFHLGGTEMTMIGAEAGAFIPANVSGRLSEFYC
jgi:hypothetical protein